MGKCVASIFDFQKEIALRKERSLSRKGVAAALDVDHIKLYRLEKGQRCTNDLDMMNNMAVLYDCYLDDFVKDGYYLQ